MGDLILRGMMGSERCEVRCTAGGMEGPESVTNWLTSELGGEAYSLEAVTALAPELVRLFGASLEVVEVDEEGQETPAGPALVDRGDPAHTPAPDPLAPQSEPQPDPSPPPTTDPALPADPEEGQSHAV
jgi:hypothetical protein